MRGGGVFNSVKNPQTSAETISFTINIYSGNGKSYANSGVGGTVTLTRRGDASQGYQSVDDIWTESGTKSLTGAFYGYGVNIKATPADGYKLNEGLSDVPYYWGYPSTLDTLKTTFNVYFDNSSANLTWIEHRSNKTFPSDHGNSAEDAYEISSAGDLAQLAYNVNNGTNYSGKYFKQTADINLDGYGWVPIGDASHSFAGLYDGQGYNILGLYMRTGPEKNCVGLFGNISNTHIQNARLINAHVEGDGQYVGTLVGGSNNSHINNCSSIDGYVLGGSFYVGGLCGYIGSMINNCYASGFVHGNSYVGGLAGDGGGGCSNCINYCTVEGYAHVGGISGSRNSKDAYLARCINYGTIIGVDGHAAGFGGIVGVTSGEILDCVTDCEIKLKNDTSAAGAFAGASDNIVARCTGNVVSNMDIGQFQAAANGWNTVNPVGCFSIVNGKKYYSDGDFSSWVLDESRGELPTNKELFWTGAPDKTSDEIVAYLSDVLGFEHKSI